VDPARHEEIAHSLFRESNDAFILFNPTDNRVVDLNPAALRLTGYERKAALGILVTDLLHSDDPNGVRNLIEAYRKTGFFHSREGYQLKRPDGTPLAVNVSVTRIHTSPDPLGLAVIRDISERRKAQELLEQFFRFSPALFAIISPEGRIVRSNVAFEKTLGYTADELRAKPAREFLAGDAPQSAGRDPADEPAFESRCRTKDGAERVVSWSTAKVDSLTYAVGLDVTVAKQAAELRRAKEAADLANQAKGHFLARMSHELRTPLTAILGLIDVVMDDPSFRLLASERADDVKTVKRNGEHLLQLINNVLDLSRIEEGKLEVHAAPCDPERIANEVAEMLRVRADSKRIALVVERVSAVPPTIRTDPVYLRQILLNLVGNAIKFTDKGSVRLRIGLERDVTPAPRLRFDVIDSGPGLAPDAIPALFEQFHQLDVTQRRSPGGTGLGLFISRQLAQAIGGEIRVESEVGQGSTFTLVLPAVVVGAGGSPADQLAGVRAASHRREPSSLGHCRLLLAEDNPDNRRAIELRLQQMGAEVTLARDGQEAYEAAMAANAGGRPFDVILMDMQMPGLDGYEATRRLRSQGYHAPIIALTAYALDEDRAECLESGCDEHISKPIDWDRLVHLVEPRCGQSSAVAQPDASG
jgi:PAS domain S-box-containing protein